MFDVIVIIVGVIVTLMLIIIIIIFYCHLNKQTIGTVHIEEYGNYSDVLPLKAARRDSISNLTSFGASNLNCRRTQCGLI